MLVSRPVSPSRITAPRGTGSYGSREPGFIAAVSSGRHTSFSLFSSTLNRWTQSERESPGGPVALVVLVVLDTSAREANCDLDR